MIVPAQLEQHERFLSARAAILRPRKNDAAEVEATRRRVAEERCRQIIAKYRLYYDSRSPNETRAASRKEKTNLIISSVAQAMGVTELDIVSDRRTVNVVIARQFAMWLVRRNTTFSLIAIGRRFGDRDHSTAIHACRKIDRLIAAGQLPDALMALVREGK